MRDACDAARLSAFLDDELDEAMSLRVSQHAAACSTCTGELDEVRTAR
ncbi:MAG: anti-sigma factor RsiW, partial [Glaciecola sp.]